MTDAEHETAREAFVAWYKKHLTAAVQEMIDQGVVSAIGESRLAWALPHAVLIGQVREVNQKEQFRWVIAGQDVPTDHLDSAAAATPRDAARHFALKWQLGAEQVRNLPERAAARMDAKTDLASKAEKLALQAEALYELVESDDLWQQQYLHL